MPSGYQSAGGSGGAGGPVLLFVQEADPGAVGAGKVWAWDSLLKIRNPDNDAWITIGVVTLAAVLAAGASAGAASFSGPYGGTDLSDGMQLIGDAVANKFLPVVPAGWQWDVANGRWQNIAIATVILTETDYIIGEDFALKVGVSAITSNEQHPFTVRGGDANEANHEGAPLSLEGGFGRGDAQGGDVVFKTSRAGDSNTITGEVIVAGNTSADVEIAGTLANFPVDTQNLVVTFTDSSVVPQQVFGQADGTINGDIGSGGTNTWDPVTGVFSFSYAGASTGPVLADYFTLTSNPLVASAKVRAADGILVAEAGLGVGNSASATTPGSVVKKIQVFDGDGNSLGYVPVYDAIT